MAVTNPMFLVFLYRYGLGLIFLVGFTGNLASIITFLRPNLRETSTGILFLILAISDTVFLLVSIFDFVEVGLTQGPIFLSDYDNLCRFRWFLKGFIQFSSAWFLVAVAIDRWVRTRFSFKANRLCTRRNALIAVMLVVISGTALHSHMLSPQLFGKLLPGIATSACGPVDFSSSYVNFYFIQWSIIQVFLSCLIPVVLMLFGSIDIHCVIQKSKNRVQPTRVNQPQQLRRDHLHRQMLLLMISSIMIFFATTLPVSVRRIVAAYEVNTGQTSNPNEILSETAILTVLLSLNFAINFYVHCLASKLFRDEFIQSLKMFDRLRRRAMGINADGLSRTVMPVGANVARYSRAMVPTGTNAIALVEIYRNQT